MRAGLARLWPLLAALSMPVVAWLSQRGWFGPDNATVSDRYPTLLVPAGYAFGIWGLIFLLDVVLAAQVWRSADRAPASLHRAMRWAAAGFGLCALWMVLFPMQWFVLALATIWLALACLLVASIEVAAHNAAPRLALWALTLHAGWLSVAAFANAAQLLVAMGSPAAPQLGWSLLLWAAAAALLLLLNAKLRGQGLYAVAAVWGLLAVTVKQADATLPGAQTSAAVAALLAALLLAQTMLLRRRATAGALPPPVRPSPAQPP